ncbi:D-amino acid dehydrogenase (quinone) [Lentibacillus sp. JNUCC-1]|uniref:NAD(P)/FAD-dependent oxidoreductase n=1 Tax=Lentibacillus sp. JNUCC-1 TaxID=2654513 RepID=UPI0012E84768|nr:FAD-dependent oxidoreductase [Lentibacillus sp. JNUCC-1]MUV38876.1 D-amino acid dehydrogenase (quinone) [Lentibacillus sp. JNUCC-1]
MKKYIVIGAGILGASCAYYLARSGADVTIIDRNEPGAATDAAAGIVSPWLSKRRNKAWYHLAVNGARLYPELVDELQAMGQADTGYKKVGGLNIHTDPDVLDDMAERARLKQKEAPEIGEVKRLDAEQTKAFFPMLADGYEAVYLSGAARVDGRALKTALLNAAQAHGAKFVQAHADLDVEAGQVKGVKLGSDYMAADQVIAANGAWMRDTLVPLGVTFRGWPQKGQIMHVQLDDTEPSDWPVINPPGRHYVLGFRDRLVIGATRDDWKGFNTDVTVDGAHEILSQALNVIPALKDARILETRVGFRPVTVDAMPVIGTLPGYEGLLLANGLGSSGITIGPFVGQQLARWALDQQLDIDPDRYVVSTVLR